MSDPNDLESGDEEELDWHFLDPAAVHDDAGEWVHFDEYEDAVLAIEMASEKLAVVGSWPRQWKWVIVGMQNAIQCAMVLALSGTDGCGALEEKSQRANRAWLDQITNQRPRQHMADYNTLLARIRKPELMEGPIPNLTEDDVVDLKRLNQLRRQFAHYNPTGWGIEINFMVKILPAALDIFEHLMTTQGRPNIHFDSQQRRRMTEALAAARSSLLALRQV